MKNYSTTKKANIFFVLTIATALSIPSMAQTKVAQENTSEKPQQQAPANEYKTLFGDDIHYGGYGALSIGYTNVGDYNAVSVGVQGAWVIGGGVGIGLAGRGFVSETTTYNTTDDWSFLGGGYGGLLIEPIFLGKQPIHFTTPIIVGLGGVSYSNSILNEFNYYENATEWDEFFVVEPGVELEINITRFFRLAAGVSYRFASDVELSYSSPISSIPQNVDILDNLNGFNYKLCFKFGKF